ncbi:MAG: biotin/lipoyl-containing protein [Tepidanaerobacteraceae bacterium]|jgi:biotin carboxyl carrier protein
MKKYKITVNGQSYEVEVEEIGGETQPTAPIQQKSAVEAKPEEKQQPASAAPAPKPAAASPKPATDTVGKTTIEAPMPGTILSIKAKSGAQVSKGDVIMILEAMKMENEIFAPESGTVTIEVTEGTSVNTGDLLAVIE